jgi:hypothetical protein
VSISNWIQTAASVYAANDLNPITDATFSGTGLVEYAAEGGVGNYVINAAPGAVLGVSAPNYQTIYYQTATVPWNANIPGNGPMLVALTYIGGWPQTY